MSNQVRRLSKLSTQEVSLVGRAANKKRFALAKSATYKVNWPTAYVNNLPDSAFLFVEEGGKDEHGKTVPRTKRHFPYKNGHGEIDLPHLRNAIARIPQSNAPGLSAEKKASLQEKARKLLDAEHKSMRKSGDDFMKTKDLMIDAVTATEAEGEEEFVATLKSAGVNDASKLAALVASYRVAKNFSDLVSPSDMAHVQMAAAHTSHGYPHFCKQCITRIGKMSPEELRMAFSSMADKKCPGHPAEGSPEEEASETPEEEEEEHKMEYGLPGEGEPSDVPNHAWNAERKLHKGDRSMDAKSLEKIVQMVVKQVSSASEKRESEHIKKNAELLGVIKEFITSEREQKFVAKAKENFAFIPAGTDEVANVLKSAYDADPKRGEELEQLLGRVNEALAKSPMLKSFGSTGANAGSGGDAWGRIRALANQMVTKGDSSFNEEKAIAQVLKTDEGRALYEQYINEHPAQRAKHPHER